MMTYKEMKKRLRNSPENISLKHFAEDFYNDFCKARETEAEQDWNKIYASPFYQMDSFAYCVFLEEFEESLPIWEIQLFKRGRLKPYLISTKFVHEISKNAARRAARNFCESYDADNAIVIMREE